MNSLFWVSVIFLPSYFAYLCSVSRSMCKTAEVKSKLMWQGFVFWYMPIFCNCSCAKAKLIHSVRLGRSIHIDFPVTVGMELNLCQCEFKVDIVPLYHEATQVLAMFYDTDILLAWQLRVNCLVCLGKILEHLDRWYVMDEVLPMLQQIPSREPAVLMSILGTTWPLYDFTQLLAH